MKPPVAQSQSKFTVTGKRLDAQATPLEADQANAGWDNDPEHAFIVVGIDIPTLGCWQITGNYNGDKLTFVI